MANPANPSVTFAATERIICCLSSNFRLGGYPGTTSRLSRVVSGSHKFLLCLQFLHPGYVNYVAAEHSALGTVSNECTFDYHVLVGQCL